MKRFLLRVLKESINIWSTLCIGSVLTSILYAILSANSVPKNTSLLIAFLVLLALVLFSQYGLRPLYAFTQKHFTNAKSLRMGRSTVDLKTSSQLQGEEEASYGYSWNYGAKAQPKSFVRRFGWQITAIVSILLVILLAYSNISLLLSRHTDTPPTPSPIWSTPTTSTADTPTPALTPTVQVQTSLPCNVNLSTWTDGSSDWKILNGVLLNDGTNEWDSGKGPSIVAPCQLGSTANYAVEAQIQVTSSSNYGSCFGITLRGTPASDAWRGYKAGVGDCGYNTRIARISGPNYSYDEQKKDASFDPTTSKHTYRVEAKNNTITFFIDGGQILTMTDNRYLTGGEVGLWSQNTQLQVFSFQVLAL